MFLLPRANRLDLVFNLNSLKELRAQEAPPAARQFAGIEEMRK